MVVTFEEARSIVEQHASEVTPGAQETVDLLGTAGRVLAEPIAADRDIPPFPRSTRDGYALRADDLRILPATLKVMGEIKAGPATGQNQPRVNAGETFSIMTGAPVPADADAVVMVEYTSRRGDSVEVNKAVEAGENIVAQGAEAKRGSLLLHQGARLNEAGIALCASVGKAQVAVFARPRVAVLTTGDEIVAVESQPGAAQIRNSNSYSLAVQILQAGGDPMLLGIAPDEPRRLRLMIEEGLQFDLLLITGGVSMGRYDLVEQVLSELQAGFFFTGAKIQPGRPVVFGRVKARSVSRAGAPRKGGSEPRVGAPAPHGHKYFFGLPGNPVSTMVTFELFARPMIEALAGMRPLPLVFLHARLKSDIRVKPGLTRFLPAMLSGAQAASQVELVPWQGSGDIAAQARANCYAVIPPDREHVPAGDWVAVMVR